MAILFVDFLDFKINLLEKITIFHPYFWEIETYKYALQ